MAESSRTGARYGANLPTLTNQLYQLASGSVTSDELVRRSLDAIEASQPTLNAFRVVLTEAGARRCGQGRPQTRGGRTDFRCSGSRSRSRTTSTSTGVPTRCSAPAGTCRWPRPDAEVVRRLRAAGAVIVGKTNTCELGQWPFTSGPGVRAHPQPVVERNTRRAGRRAAARRPWRPDWSPRRSARTARAASGFPRRGRIWSASNRSGDGSPPGRCPRRSTASPSTACWPAPSPMRRWCSTPRPATSPVTCTSRRRCGCRSSSRRRRAR